MPTILKDGIKIFFDTINLNLRHQDYAHVIKIAKDYTTYATGVGIDEKLRQFNGRESEKEFDQRKKLTQANVPDIFNSCVKPLYKVGRSPATKAFTWKDADANKSVELRAKLNEAGSNFWGKKSVEKYITQRQADLDSTDPNAFVIVEFKERVDPADPKTKAKPYPFEANSAEAINYMYKNNDLQWLIVLNNIVIKDGKGSELIGEK